jgi:pyruvate formate lyase activating enzyme
VIFKGWQKTSLIEYPGRICTVLFTGGCNFRCPYCYNRKLVLGYRKMPDIESEEVIDFLKCNPNLYQAVMVTGGEPTLKQDLPGFLRKVKELELFSGLESNGSNPDLLESLLKGRLIDFAAMDIKAPLAIEKYSQASGVRSSRLLARVERSIELIMSSALEYEFRTTVAPGITSRDDLLAIGRSIKGAKRYVLQQYVPGEVLNKQLNEVMRLSAAELLQVRDKLTGLVEVCEVRNV